MFCFLASIRSLWMLPFNRIATCRHSSPTTTGIVVFWIAFYRLTNPRRGAMDGVRFSSSYSPHSGDFCLESYSSKHQNAATAQLTTAGQAMALKTISVESLHA
jgi:hypothetical protein